MICLPYPFWRVSHFMQCLYRLPRLFVDSHKMHDLKRFVLENASVKTNQKLWRNKHTDSTSWWCKEKEVRAFLVPVSVYIYIYIYIYGAVYSTSQAGRSHDWVFTAHLHSLAPTVYKAILRPPPRKADSRKGWGRVGQPSRVLLLL